MGSARRTGSAVETLGSVTFTPVPWQLLYLSGPCAVKWTVSARVRDGDSHSLGPPTAPGTQQGLVGTPWAFPTGCLQPLTVPLDSETFKAPLMPRGHIRVGMEVPRAASPRGCDLQSPLPFP